MRAHVIENGVVTNTIEVTALDALPGVTLIDADQHGGAIGDSWDGTTASSAPPRPLDPAEFVRLVQQRLDAWAQTRGYDGILSLCSYATSSIQQFAAEGQCGVNKRDQTWANLYAFVADVEAGVVPVPTCIADVEPVLPVLEWPT